MRIQIKKKRTNSYARSLQTLFGAACRFFQVYIFNREITTSNVLTYFSSQNYEKVFRISLSSTIGLKFVYSNYERV